MRIFQPTATRSAATRLGAVVAILASTLFLAVGSKPAVAATSPYSIYVTDGTANTVSPIDPVAGMVGPDIQVGAYPYGITITPDGNTAYVANFSGGTVTPINLMNNQPGAAITVGRSPYEIAISPDGTTAYVTTDAGVVPITTANNMPGTLIPLGGSPVGIALAPDGTTMYVAQYTGQSVSVIDVVHQQVIKTIPVGISPVNIAITPDGTRAYVTDYNSDEVTPIDTASNTALTAIAVGKQPAGIAITPDGTKAYVVDQNSNGVTVINLGTDMVQTTVTIVGSNTAIAITPDGKTAYVQGGTSATDDGLTPIDIASNTLGTKILVNAGFGIAIVPGPKTVASVAPTTGRPGTDFTFRYTCPRGAAPHLAVLNAELHPASDTKITLPVSGNGVSYTQHAQVGPVGLYTGFITCDGNQVASLAFTVSVGVTYAALGDSYSSGEGASAFDRTTDRPGINMCHRATGAIAYAYAVANHVHRTIDFAACSGAFIDDFFRFNPDNQGEIPQIDHLSPIKTKLVTLTIGGNNLGFPNVLTDCIQGVHAPGGKGCRTRDQALLKQAVGWLKNGRPLPSPGQPCPLLPGLNPDTGQPESICGTAPSLHDLYQRVGTKLANGGAIIVVGYPELFGPVMPDGVCQVGTASGAFIYTIDITDVEWLNSGAIQLNSVIQGQVNIANKWLHGPGKRPDVTIKFVPVDSSFGSHRLCDRKAAWINGLQFDTSVNPLNDTPKNTSFHPKDAGQAAYATAINSALP